MAWMKRSTKEQSGSQKAWRKRGCFGTCCAWFAPLFNTALAVIVIAIGSPLYHVMAMRAHEYSNLAFMALGLDPAALPLWDLGLPTAIHATTAVFVVVAFLFLCLGITRAWLSWDAHRSTPSAAAAKRRACCSSPRAGGMAFVVLGHIWNFLCFFVKVLAIVLMIAFAFWIGAAIALDYGGKYLPESIIASIWALIQQAWTKASELAVKLSQELETTITPREQEAVRKLAGTLIEKLNIQINPDGSITAKLTTGMQQACPAYCLDLHGSIIYGDMGCWCNLNRFYPASEVAAKVWTEYLIKAMVGIALVYCGLCWADACVSRWIAQTLIERRHARSGEGGEANLGDRAEAYEAEGWQPEGAPTPPPAIKQGAIVPDPAPMDTQHSSDASDQTRTALYPPVAATPTAPGLYPAVPAFQQTPSPEGAQIPLH